MIMKWFALAIGAALALALAVTTSRRGTGRHRATSARLLRPEMLWSAVDRD